MKVGIVGYGWVGRAAHLLFPNAAIHDINIEQYQDPLPECDIVFLAVPTPWNGERLDCSAVEAAIAACSSSLIVLRSATQPGFADAMAEKYNKRIVVQPEYLGESPNHPMLAMKERQFMILGGDPQDRRQVIDCYATVYNANVTIRQVTNLEAEIIKLTENRAIFWKVLQCQELYDACEAAGVDYYTIRDAVYGDDPRMNLWWTFVYPENRGANSKCLPKDVYAWAAWAESVGLDPQATRSLLRYNSRLCRPRDTHTTQQVRTEQYKNLSFPNLDGDLPLHSHIVYVSADPVYYDQYVRPLISSIVKSMDWLAVHVHLICPGQLHENIVTHERVTTSWEIIDPAFIDNLPLDDTAKAMNFTILGTEDLYQVKQKIYFSCARFVRMPELFDPNQYVLHIDADTILQQKFSKEEFEALTERPRAMRKPKDPTTLIASCISLGTGPEGTEFRQRFSDALMQTFQTGAYWYMDQDCLKKVFSTIEFENIDILWCSWGNKRGMRFFTGKGNKKNQSDFLDIVNTWR
jgi:hypothetical protein